MPLEVSCKCGRKLLVKDDLAGKPGKCPACFNILQVPGKARNTATVPAPAFRPRPPAGGTPGFELPAGLLTRA